MPDSRRRQNHNALEALSLPSDKKQQREQVFDNT